MSKLFIIGLAFKKFQFNFKGIKLRGGGQGSRKEKNSSRAFRCVAPAIWNSIPLPVRTSPSLASFKHSLKTHYFCHPPALLSFFHASDSFNFYLTTGRLINVYIYIYIYNHCDVRQATSVGHARDVSHIIFASISCQTNRHVLLFCCEVTAIRVIVDSKR